MSSVMKGIALILLLMAAALIGLAVWLGMQPKPVPAPVQLEQRTEQSPATPLHPVVVAAKELKAGIRLSANDLEVVQWPVAPSQAFDNMAELEGKMLRYQVEQGTPVLASSLALSLASYLAPGERAVTIPVDINSGANNRVLPGDLVDVFFTFSSSAEVSNTQARLLMPRVKVLAYGRDSLAGPEQAESTPARQDSQVRNAMLAVPEAAVNELLLAVRSGSLQLVLRSLEDESMPNVALFPEFATLMPAKKELSSEQKEALEDPANRALAGLSLREFSLSTEPLEPIRQATYPSAPSDNGRRIEVIRGGKIEVVQF
ncbi:Flp pilus assembly protein CpaB [Alcaligenes endophyticus]|uniref:Flp pilus assembly protein CpaB n=1 Tax=Alcaligenes endophyticus TaxID=1929088 RepID=A0ABT8EHT3_9BURK|nr:Flp pilus assembly protein CpaB [Alcaligenes endophyticus]MCX5592048.1 Flp pilus assembly protein CpaB [Alcaligenes endophyticus]MDN4120695.1 Flp pilus assembly protein CpaB [Alcaligenes endophyticus]